MSLARASAKACVYCGARGESVSFNREHVLQQGFGRFRDALVLHDLVCEACNSLFSRTIDLALTRDGLEGLERYMWGIKDAADVQSFRYGSLRVTSQDKDNFQGAMIRFGSAEDEFSARIQPSAAVRLREGDGFASFSESEILSGIWVSDAVDPQRGVKLFGDEESMLRMKAALENQGVKLDFAAFERPASRSESTFRLEYAPSDAIRRGVAKIAFNYLAYRQGGDLVRLPAFDPIRSFVRCGQEPDRPPVFTHTEMPFSSSAPDGYVPVVHWISLETHSDHRNLLGVVSLFGAITHTIILAEDYDGPWFDLPVAHLYNVKQMTATEVQPQRERWRPPDR